MRIRMLKIRNYRTIEQMDLNMDAPYIAICGPNDSGKTNVVRAIRTLMKEHPRRYYRYREEADFSFKDDYPKWKSPTPGEPISIALTIQADRDKDAALCQFLTRHLALPDDHGPMEFTVMHEIGATPSDSRVSVDLGDKHFDGVVAQEVLKKLQTSNSILFHNSTEPDPDLRFGGAFGVLGEVAAEQSDHLKAMEKYVDKTVKKIAKSHQQNIEDLLGCLHKKYRVGLSLPRYDFSFLPFSLTLGEKKYDVPLDEWGSGTQNRTLVLLTLFMAKQISQSQVSASKITPMIVVEEPECFLHPAAQAEFGTVLQDLATNFQIQVVVTTHSPYMLNIRSPGANVLLSRREHYSQPLETTIVPAAGDEWMQPFGQALGLNSDDFKPWKSMFLNEEDALVLVEGDTDKAYLEMLRDPRHGQGQLVVDCSIESYEGTGSLSNTVLLRFVKNRHRRFFVTYDLDSENTVERNLKSLQLEKGKHYSPVGLVAAGKKNIEGLLPDRIITAVHGRNPDLVQAALHGTPEEQKSAKSRLKKLMLEEFQRTAVPETDDFKHFYTLSKMINHALGK